MTPNLDVGMKLQAVAVECLRTWQNMRDSEWFAEDFVKALRSLQKHPADPEDPLEDMLFHVEALHRRIRMPLDSETAPFSELGAALLLGERIDQGLRPPGV